VAISARTKAKANELQQVQRGLRHRVRGCQLSGADLSLERLLVELSHLQEPIPWRIGRTATVWAFGRPSSRLLGTTPGDPVARQEQEPPPTEPARGITWDELQNLDRKRVEEMQAGPSARRWWGGLSGTGKWIAGIVGSIIAGVAVLLIRAWLISSGAVPP
jgi:hypothetical protein